MPHIQLKEKKVNKQKTTDASLCQICGEGHATAGSDWQEYEYGGQKAKLPLYFTTCDTCGSESAGMEESRANKRVVMAFRKSVDGLLTGEEIRALRSKYKLTQEQAARLFGGGPVAFSKYENDDVAQSESMDNLLRLVRRSAVAFWELVAEKGMTGEFTRETLVSELTETSSAKIYLFTGRQQVETTGLTKTTWKSFEPEDRKWK
jgi:HTH-type transcriptional regulator / antitoxin MqsA